MQTGMGKVTAELAHRLVFDYEKTQCFVTVAKRHGVDRRTVKTYSMEQLSMYTSNHG